MSTVDGRMSNVESVSHVPTANSEIRQGLFIPLYILYRLYIAWYGQIIYINPHPYIYNTTHLHKIIIISIGTIIKLYYQRQLLLININLTQSIINKLLLLFLSITLYICYIYMSTYITINFYIHLANLSLSCKLSSSILRYFPPLGSSSSDLKQIIHCYFY